MVEAQVSQLLLRENKPFNVQTITDCLAQYGIKKSQVQKAVDALSAEGSSVVCKEFGQQKIYFPVQTDSGNISAEEMEAKKLLHAQLSDRLPGLSATVKAHKSELQALRECMSLEEVEARTKKLQTEVEADEQKLMQLQTGAELVTADERQKVEKRFAANMEHWRKRKKIFKDLWSAISENIDRMKTDVFEEIGVEADDDEEWKLLSDHLPNKKRRM